jgi:hypothetical protein
LKLYQVPIAGSAGFAVRFASPKENSLQFLRASATEVGHVHSSGEVDIPFPRARRDELLAVSRGAPLGS